MKVNLTDVVTTTGSTATGAWAIANINDILGIIVLVLSILNIFINLIIKLYDRTVNKELRRIPDDINEVKDSINKLKDGDNNAHK